MRYVLGKVWKFGRWVLLVTVVVGMGYGVWRLASGSRTTVTVPATMAQAAANKMAMSQAAAENTPTQMPTTMPSAAVKPTDTKVPTIAPTNTPQSTATSQPTPTAVPTYSPTTTLTGTLSSALSSTLTTTMFVSSTMAVTSGEFRQGWNTGWYRSPFTKTTDSLAVAGTVETFAEPGVLLDNTAAFDHMSAVDTPVLVPEGGYAYVAIGEMLLSHNGSNLLLPYVGRNIYLVIVRGLPDDGGPTDLNQIVLASQYVRATGVYSPMPAGAHVSLAWMVQQVTNAFRDPNCGGTGCQQATIVVVDLKTHSYRSWVVNDPKNPRAWVRVG